MANDHFEKWIFKSVLGCSLIGGGIMFMYYSLVYFVKENWILFGIIPATAVSLGAFFLSSAAVNKTKSDLIKKQKMRQQTS